ncbi:recombinase family protein [uncultured Oscillibacter sp.]|uniref:recombinase family protein n=1 Tax=uncultured Oscillibacter sp. TaxID=876091 RepID=UPI00260BF0EA|nr:recombinase family protein [uncultured Oscillibacter sp.]
MLLGYVRVSTVEQNEARQIEALKQKGVNPENFFIDKQSGKNTDRPALKEMLAFVRRGDCVVTESISRIARNTKDLLNIVEQLQCKGVEFVSMKESLDTTTPQGKFMLTIFAAMAELERDSILQRQREGIEVAKAEGKYKGRQPIQIDKSLFESTVADWRAGQITARKAMEIVGLKPNTFYRRIKELNP